LSAAELPSRSNDCTIKDRFGFATGACTIKHRIFSRFGFYCVFLALFLLAACLPDEAQQSPLAQATLTPTPRSTPLPPVPTVIPPGVEDNPIQMVIRAATGRRNLISDAQVEDFQDAILDKSGLIVRIMLVDRYAEALAALCDSRPTNVAVAWVDGVSYEAAKALECGEPVLQIERGSQTGDSGQIVTNGALQIGSLGSLSDANFCRLGYDDYYSWLVPSLILQANGIDLANGLTTVTDYPDADTLIEAVADGECAATGISESAFDDLRGTVRSDLDVLETSAPFPYGVLIYPIALTLGERLRLTDALLALSTDLDGGDVMKPFFSQDGLTTVESDDFDALSSFLGRTGLDFAQLGS
jgi:ABC-type phosphate/phosphonate transport system substrate-binding protein